MGLVDGWVLRAVPLCPEVRMFGPVPDVGLFELGGGDYRSDAPPPFWAFAWAGGQVLGRYVLDHPELVAGRRVLDVGAGGGVAGIAAALAGAAEVRAFDVDPAAVTAIGRNAAANGVTVRAEVGDVAAAAGPVVAADVVLAGDVFYAESTAGRMRAFLRRAGREALVLVGDPGRGYFPERMFTEVARHVVPVPAVLEQARRLSTGVWRLDVT
jgi:predicted nicotinamide N-methyase